MKCRRKPAAWTKISDEVSCAGNACRNEKTIVQAAQYDVSTNSPMRLFVFLPGRRRNEGFQLLDLCLNKLILCAIISTFERLYGHDWQTEAANAAGLPAIGSLDEYFKLCYNELMRIGVGSGTCRFIVTNTAVLDRLAEQPETKEFARVYVKPFFKEKRLTNKAKYSYEWQYYDYISSRGNGYCIELKQTVTRR